MQYVLSYSLHKHLWTVTKTVSHDGKVRILNFDSKCAFWVKIRKTVFFTVCTPNHIAMRNWNAHFKWRSRGAFQKRISQITQQNHCMNALTSKSWFAEWPSNHFRLYTALCICTEAQEMRAPCMFDWQGTQTFFSCWNAKSQIRSLVCTTGIATEDYLLLVGGGGEWGFCLIPPPPPPTNNR